MSARVTIDLDTSDPSSFAVVVDVTGDLSTLETIGLLEAAKRQYLNTKHIQGPVASQTPTPAPTPES